MPLGKRYQIVLNGIIYDLSPEQFQFLSNKSLKLPKILDWNTEQRIKGLIKSKLFTKQPRSYKRTNLGEKVFNALSEKVKNKIHF